MDIIDGLNLYHPIQLGDQWLKCHRNSVLAEGSGRGCMFCLMLLKGKD
jgi:hypothetical protein